MLTCVDKFDIRKSTDRIAKYHAVLSFPISVWSLAPWFDLLGYGVVPRKSPEWAAKAFAVFPLGCVVHCCSEPCTASGVLDKRFMARCMQWSNMRKYRKVHVLKYRKVLKQFCANKNKKTRKNAEKIIGSEKKRKSAENFHVWTLGSLSTLLQSLLSTNFAPTDFHTINRNAE